MSSSILGPVVAALVVGWVVRWLRAARSAGRGGIVRSKDPAFELEAFLQRAEMTLLLQGGGGQREIRLGGLAHRTG